MFFFVTEQGIWHQHLNRGLGISTLANAPALKKKCLNKIILRQRTFHAINQLGKTFPILFDFLPLFLQRFYNKIFFFFWGNERRPYYLLSSCALFPPGVTNWCGWDTFIQLQNSILLPSWKISWFEIYINLMSSSTFH